jgi:hypothetical protein
VMREPKTLYITASHNFIVPRPAAREPLEQLVIQ